VTELNALFCQFVYILSEEDGLSVHYYCVIKGNVNQQEGSIVMRLSQVVKIIAFSNYLLFLNDLYP
jgi:hypothetical protein